MNPLLILPGDFPISRSRRPDATTVEPTFAPPTEPDRCELCDRDKPLTFHHLIPKAVHKKNRFRDKYSKDEMRNAGLFVCDPCHSGIHDLIPDEKELAARFATKELLLAHDPIARHVAWVARQK